MNTRILIALTGLTILIVASKATAADEFSQNHRELALEFVEITHVRSSYENGLGEGLDAQIEAAPQMAAFREVLEKWHAAYLSWDVFEEKYIEVMCRAYSEEDLEGLIAFYGTELGIKQLDKVDEITIEALKFTQQMAASRQPELSILMGKRMKELEMEVENLFPEYKEDAKTPEDKKHPIHTSMNLIGQGMKNLVYPLSAEEIRSRADFDPQSDELSVSPGKALQLAYEKYYKTLNIDSEEYWESVDATFKSFTLESDDIDNVEPTVIWFYVIRCSVFGNYPAFGMPVEIVVLMDGQVIEPMKGAEGESIESLLQQ